MFNLNLYVDNMHVLRHLWYANICLGSRQRSYTVYVYTNYLYLLNSIEWILVKVHRAQIHSTTQCIPDVDDICYILFNLFSPNCKRIFPHSTENNIAYLQMWADHCMFNDMRKILINNIIMHMNVGCTEMTSSEIANFTVEVQNVKTFY